MAGYSQANLPEVRRNQTSLHDLHDLLVTPKLSLSTIGGTKSFDCNLHCMGEHAIFQEDDQIHA